ncbi:MAG: glutathione-dependent disulfide-bond oxidoreductase, partial [Tetragenococcus halophilus]|nr:glutathione-dependent disulfide-bond oxidoreductase [Tetragenococcus halophilus]MDN6569312.1 glutathione-dependent disulfide-bond oxidoreductase [Tetragenococcus halophilus]
KAKEYKNLKAWTDRIAQRPGVQRGINVEYQAIK